MQVVARYSPERSQPSGNKWFFLYTVTISNEGADTVQLLTRHWIITDGTGDVEEVRGPGRRRQAADAGARRIVRVHVRMPADDAVRRHGRHVPDDHRRAANGSTPGSRPFTLSEPYTVH